MRVNIIFLREQKQLKRPLVFNAVLSSLQCTRHRTLQAVTALRRDLIFHAHMLFTAGCIGL